MPPEAGMTLPTGTGQGVRGVSSAIKSLKNNGLQGHLLAAVRRKGSGGITKKATPALGRDGSGEGETPVSRLSAGTGRCRA